MKPLVAFLCIFLCFSCAKNDDDFSINTKDYSEENDAEILQYISDHNLTATKTDSGLYYVIEELGTGEQVSNVDLVSVSYKMSATNNNTILDLTTNNLNLPDILLGLSEGISLFKEGGKGTLILPSHLAYGNNPTNSKISAGQVVIFDIEVKSIVGYSKTNDTEIQKYLSDNNLTATKTDSGLYYIIEEEGTGSYPTATSNVTVAYKGYYTDNNVFDQSSSSGINFNLQNVISGWTEGITYFNKGSKGKLLIPAHLGYGNLNYRTIAGGSVLIFDIHLISFN